MRLMPFLLGCTELPKVFRVDGMKGKREKEGEGGRPHGHFALSNETSEQHNQSLDDRQVCVRAAVQRCCGTRHSVATSS